MRRLFFILRYLIQHPLTRDQKLSAVTRFVIWQINCVINPYPVIYNFTEKAKLIVAKGMTGATGNYYCGLHEFADMSFLLHLLRPEDVFVDVGANVGSYSVLASAHVGARSIAIEPVPKTFQALIQNIAINQIGNLVLSCNVAVGSNNGHIEFTSNLDTVNHVATELEKDKINVQVTRLDDLMQEVKCDPLLLKIDVEGFETEVIRGSVKTLNSSTLKAIIIELNGSGKRYHFDEEQIHNQLLSYGFSPFHYNPFGRALVASNRWGTHNTVYIRDQKFVADRLISSDGVKILSKII